MLIKHKALNRGMTLVELSLVIAVIALLTITITGSFVIRQTAMINSIIKEQMQHRTNVADFIKTYNAIPGDFNDAWYQFTDSTIRSQAINTIPLATIQKQALNGDGNGYIYPAISTITTGGGTTYYSEMYAIWVHMKAANIISDVYNITCRNGTNATNCSNPGFNIPRSRALSDTNSGYLLFYPNNTTTYGAIMGGPQATNRHVITLGNFLTQNANGFHTTGAVSAETMMRIDSKFDDGNPLTGNIVSMNSATIPCHTSTNSTYISNATYIYPQKNMGCIPVFIAYELTNPG